MTNVDCVFYGPRTEIPLSPSRSQQTEIACEVSHDTHGVKELGRPIGYTLSSSNHHLAENRPDNYNNSFSNSRINPKKIKNRRKKWKKIIKKVNLRYYKIFKYLENLKDLEKSDKIG